LTQFAAHSRSAGYASDDRERTFCDEQEYRKTHWDCCGGVTAGTIVAGGSGTVPMY
jgi:hypothetical protein